MNRQLSPQYKRENWYWDLCLGAIAYIRGASSKYCMVSNYFSQYMLECDIEVSRTNAENKDPNGDQRRGMMSYDYYCRWSID